MPIVLVVVAVIVCLFSIGFVAFYFSIEKNAPKVVRPEFRPEAIFLHTNHPKGGKMSPRGFRILSRACDYARRYDAPLVLVAGATVPSDPRTEAELYADASRSLGYNGAILLGSERKVLNTEGEIVEGIRIFIEHRVRHVLVVAADSHILRARRRWRESDVMDAMSIEFLGVSVGLRSNLYDYVSMLVRPLLPQGTHRRDFVLRIMGRGTGSK
jgi:hypothetical protein